ncbi:glycosyltransferase family 4 protein [Pseudomonas gingeri]|uniref:Glycosyltransferase family 4 protein n=1 Tax=Pseudomonas gingeri TaxID=117681 RepID=A0A7Y7YCM1_9PSED|nr:glycosyltransferase family 4 protein [Pseudomonas gingeri]NWB25365.1 glycosyltransferase family 4 protein [Pseudomonas gingeri]NWC33406.1 glycosyltransferase family 4 protein [Pseudomonas gingeri]
MNKVFVVSEYVYSAQNSTGYFWSKVIDRVGLTYGGVKVIAPVSIASEKSKSAVSGVEYVEFQSVNFNKNRLFSRLLGQLQYCIRFLYHIARHVRRNDVVLSGTNPALLLMLLPVLKWLLGFRWCLLVHDVFPENLVPAGILKKNGLIYSILSWLFSIIYSRADHIIVIGRDMKELVSKKIEARVDITVIQNWVSDQDVVLEARDNSELIDRLGWKDKVVFQFFGNIGRVQGVDNLLAAIRLVSDRRAVFLFIGDGAAVETLRSFIECNGRHDVAYIGPVSQSEKSKGLAACDVALITLEQGMLGLGVPSKAYFSMAADKPLLAVMDSQAEIAQMINDDSIGWHCDASDPVALAALIDHVCQQDLTLMSGRSRKVLQDKYSEAKALEKFITCINTIMKVRPS